MRNIKYFREFNILESKGISVEKAYTLISIFLSKAGIDNESEAIDAIEDSSVYNKLGNAKSVVPELVHIFYNPGEFETHKDALDSINFNESKLTRKAKNLLIGGARW